MCYCCNLCNRCGRAEELKNQLGKRVCFSCGKEASDNNESLCTGCGSKLPPPFPLIKNEAQ